MNEPLGSVHIGAREIYAAVVRLTAAVDRLTDQHSDQAQDIRDHEARLRSLERGRWPLPSAAVLISVAAAVMALIQLVR